MAKKKREILKAIAIALKKLEEKTLAEISLELSYS